MLKEINTITKESCKNLSLRIQPNKANQITTDQLSERCDKASSVYAKPFREYLLSEYDKNS